MRTQDRLASILPHAAYREICTMDPGWRRREWIVLEDRDVKHIVISTNCFCDQDMRVKPIHEPAVDFEMTEVQLVAQLWRLEDAGGLKEIIVWTGVCPKCDRGYFAHFPRTLIREKIRCKSTS